jgi:hypothetical protein
MIPVDFGWILIWDKLHWKCYLIIFYAYIKHPKRSSDATWTSILILMLTCHSSNGHDNCKNSSNGYWWHQQYLLLLFWESLTSTTSVATITVATGQISPVAIVKITHVSTMVICNSVGWWNCGLCWSSLLFLLVLDHLWQLQRIRLISCMTLEGATLAGDRHGDLLGGGGH